jgi:RimJ/RimL family protein N-acetyltransferase
MVLATPRLQLRWLHAGDAAFILRLVNDPSWLRYIGDKGVRTIEDAERYIGAGPAEMYGRLGFGLYLVELLATAVPIGLCGLIKRDALEDVDLGFAFAPEYWGNGYAYEAGAAVMVHAQRAFGLKRVVAITSTDNDRSGKVLGRLGFRYERLLQLAPDSEELKLYGADL